MITSPSVLRPGRRARAALARSALSRIARAACAASAIAISGSVLPAQPAQPCTPTAHVGVGLRAVDGVGVVVASVLPGPLNGDGYVAYARDFGAPDLVVAVNGAPPTATTLRDLACGGRPGQLVTIAYRRARARGWSVDARAVGHHAAARTIRFALAAPDAWRGVGGRAPALGPREWREVAGASLHDVLRPSIDSLGLAHDADATARLLRDRLPRDLHTLPVLQSAMAEPMSAPAVARAIARDAAAIVGARTSPPAGAIAFLARAIAADTSPRAIAAAPATLDDVAATLARADRSLRAALGPLAGDSALARAILATLRRPRRDPNWITVHGPEAARHLDVVRRSERVNADGLLRALADLAALTALDPAAGALRSPIRTPPVLGVTGPLLAARLVPGLGWIVVGDTARNGYDMRRIAAVIDLGGDDRYEMRALATGVRAVVDLSGDDAYRGTDLGVSGALLGITVVDDRAGNDRYEEPSLGAGSAAFGASLLLDRAGNDVYRGGEWTVGAAAVGAAALVDLAGDDEYHAEFLSIGVGGPKGVGVVVDQAGRDRWTTHLRDTLGAPAGAGAASLSIGVGFGFARYAAGGLGVVADLAGDDSYESGAYAQGAGYRQGIGVLYDASGADRYRSGSDAQGAGVHSAIGALLDGGGDDVYVGDARVQGSGFDLAVGVLEDAAGDDHYAAHGEAQGVALHQSLGLLVERSGDDWYQASGGVAQGHGGDNGFWFAASGVRSLGVLLDESGRDRYSTGHADGRTVRTGTTAVSDSAGAPRNGLRIDLPVTPP